MIKIEIIFNKENYLSEYYEEIITLESSFNYNDEIRIISEFDEISLPNRKKLIDLFEQLRGTDNESLKLKFYENNYLEWAKANFYEQQTFKSLVLIYHWLELALANPHDLDVKKNFYNEFIVDWNYRPGFQNTIFLLPEKYIKDSKKIQLLDNLITINLLCKIKIHRTNEVIENYFIPILTPGVPIEYYKTDFDPDGSKSYTLWKDLLADRNYRIKSWTDNRF